LGLLPATVDELVQATGRAPGEVAAALAELEVGGLVAEGDGTYRALA
jgi:predicted Rossmann fold nucleotide-binding protein DprA/Smf involved in DNA uptake